LAKVYNFLVVLVQIVEVVEPLVVLLLLWHTSAEELLVELNDIMAGLVAVLDRHVEVQQDDVVTLPLSGSVFLLVLNDQF
jgi:hypothetical protein